MADLILKNITKIYPGNVKGVAGFSLEIKDRELLVVVGPSGSGKTTLLRLIAGLEEVTAGEIILNGQIINDLPPKKRSMAMMFQNHILFPHMTVFDNMAFGLKLRGMKKDKIDRRVNEIAETLNIKNLIHRYPHALSGGERQRAALGRAILREPDLFLLDEPLSNLDAHMRTRMRTEIRRIQKKLNATMLFVTHDQREAMTMGDRIAVLKDGMIQQVADPVTLYEKPKNMFVAGFIGSPGMNFFTGEIEDRAGDILFKHHSFSIKLPQTRQSGLKPYKGKKVILGLRPEHIMPVNPGSECNGKYKTEMNSLVNAVEHLGSHTCLHLLAGYDSYTAFADPHTPLTPGQETGMDIDISMAIFFNVDTGDTI